MVLELFYKNVPGSLYVENWDTLVYYPVPRVTWRVANFVHLTALTVQCGFQNKTRLAKYELGKLILEESSYTVADPRGQFGATAPQTSVAPPWMALLCHKCAPYAPGYCAQRRAFFNLPEFLRHFEATRIGEFCRAMVLFQKLAQKYREAFAEFFQSSPNLPPLRTPIALTQKLWQNTS